jgi:ribosomal protein L11 methyltransferase
MYRVFAEADRKAIEQAAEALNFLEDGPVVATSIYEVSRLAWRLEAYCNTAADADGALAILEVAVPTLDARMGPLEEEDWIAKSLEGLPAVHAGPFLIAGAHALGEKRGEPRTLWIEAGAAFGTGHHGTTRGCIGAIARAWNLAEKGGKRPRRVLDVGTGTGVLGIAAARLGATHVIASDIDPVAVKVTAANARGNNTQARVKTLQGAGTNRPRIRAGAPYDLVVANILFQPLVRLSGQLARMVKPGGRVIVSGLLVHQDPLARAAFTGHGLTYAGRTRDEGWLTLEFVRPAAPAQAPAPAAHGRGRVPRRGQAI